MEQITRRTIKHEAQTRRSELGLSRLKRLGLATNFGKVKLT